MVPSLVIGVREWPRTSSAKIDRQALPPADVAYLITATTTSPRSAAEAAVREAFASILSISVELISVEASFFAIGGNSLKAAVLAQQLSKMFGRAVSAGTVMQWPTVAALAKEGREMWTLPPLTRSTYCTALHPVSWNQSQLLTVHLVEGARAAYNISLAYWLHGPLNVLVLRRALVSVVERHEVLRTTFDVDSDTGFMQRTHEIPQGDALLSELTAPSAEAAEKLGLAGASKGFELEGEEGRVMRSTLIRVEAEQHLLLITVHHVAFDGASKAVLLRELGACYRSAMSSDPAVTPVPLLELPAQYVDYALWQRSAQLEALTVRSCDYWRLQLR
jgi:acyl carrier protein